MARWKQGESIYNQLVTNLAEYVSNQLDILTVRESKAERVIDFARAQVDEFVNSLKVSDLLLIHEYLMYMTEMRPDKTFPSYVYSGGDRVASVTRYLLKNIDLELAKQYA